MKVSTKILVASVLALAAAGTALANLANGTINAKVVSAQGAPVEKALVQIYYTQVPRMSVNPNPRYGAGEMQVQKIVVGKGLTDADGKVTIANLPPRAYRYTCRVAGLGAANGDVTVDDGKAIDLTVTLEGKK